MYLYDRYILYIYIIPYSDLKLSYRDLTYLILNFIVITAIRYRRTIHNVF